MVPSAFVQLAEIPFTTSGKVDRRRLPEPELEAREHVATPPANVAETLVLEAFGRALGRTDLGVEDDFFDFGGNSIKAVAVVAALAADFSISANDLFRLRTARAVAREIPMRRGDLHGRLTELVTELRAESNGHSDPLVVLARDVEQYRARYKPFTGLSVHQHMAYRDVLLTGATGFLGCYLMRDLLERSDAKLHVTIRGKSRDEAYARLAAKSAHYFGADFLESHRRRINVVLSDLEQPMLGLDRGTFDALARTIDCAIHAAALTKHYGDYATFVKANVDATKHVIELARRSGCDLNVVSTISVGLGDIPGRQRALFTEFDCDIGQVAGNHYVRTKLEAEKAVLALRDEGLACNIFRVGFLTGDSRTLKFQDERRRLRLRPDAQELRRARQDPTVGADPVVLPGQRGQRRDLEAARRELAAQPDPSRRSRDRHRHCRAHRRGGSALLRAARRRVLRMARRAPRRCRHRPGGDRDVAARGPARSERRDRDHHDAREDRAPARARRLRVEPGAARASLVAGVAMHVDVLIIGAGLSGIGAARHLQRNCTGKTYAILEARDRLGGTWDLFRYPGIRSDSDMYTLGYSFKPWTDAKAIADGPAILAYIEETATESGIDAHIHFDQRVTAARWSSHDAHAGRSRPRRRGPAASSSCAPVTTTTPPATRPSCPAASGSPARSSTRSTGPRRSTTPASASS